MLRLASVAALIAVGATAVYAQNVAVIKERQKLYESQGKAVKQPNAAYKGTDELDLDKVKAALKLIQDNAGKLPKLFPDDSKTGGDTEALPAIWENKKDFEERFLKLAEAAKAAETAISDEATFKSEWPKVLGVCSECHKKYRKEKK